MIVGRAAIATCCGWRISCARNGHPHQRLDPDADEGARR